MDKYGVEQMSFGKSLRKIWPALLLACFGFSGLVVSDVFAEVTDPVCRTLIAHANVEGEWSPAVTVCAGKAEDGSTILMSMAGTSDYYRAGANTSGVASTATIDVDDNADPERGAVFYGNAGSGKVTVGGLNWWDSHDSGGSFTASDGSYNGNPGKFVDDVLSGGKKQIGSDTLSKVRYVPSSGGATISGAVCVQTIATECDRGAMENYRNAIAAQGYSIEDCTWNYSSTGYDGSSVTYTLVCGAVPASTYEITYTLEVVTESDDVAKAVAEGVTTNGVQTGTSDNVKDLCYQAGVDDQGWFLCPTLNNMTYTAGAFDLLIQDWLSVDSNLYDSNSNAYAVWTAMRDIANVLMIILLMVVIFSQLTGYGIDNYGIKKMLPRLITMAVLINLSFVICELAVDLSNILGVGLRNMFGALGNGLPNELDGIDFVAGVVTGLLGAVVGAGAVGGTVVAIASVAASGPMVVVILILALLSVLAALLLFFAALGARMIMIILCVATAPVAFALFILPNTQSIFKKWWNIFKTALIMFPICGALGGISNLIKGMVGNSGDVWMQVVALITPFLVFFLLPMLLKGAVAALGQIGGALQTMGQSLTGGARNLSGAVQNTERFKNAQDYSKDLSAARRAQRVQNRLGNRDRNTLSARQRARLVNAEKTLSGQRMQEAEARAGVFVPDEGLAMQRATASRDAAEFKAYQDQFADLGQDDLLALAGGTRDAAGNVTYSSLGWLGQPGGEQRMRALIGAMESRGMESGIYSMLRQNNVSGMTSVMNSLADSNNKVLKAYGKRGVNTDFNSFMTGDGANSLKGYAAEKGADFVNGLDDKALAEIARDDAASVAAGNGHIISTDQLVQAAAQLNDESSMAEVNSMLSSRTDIGGKISADQAANFNASTVHTLLNGGNPNARRELGKAVNAIANDPQMISKLSSQTKQMYNSAFGHHMQ